MIILLELLFYIYNYTSYSEKHIYKKIYSVIWFSVEVDHDEAESNVMCASVYICYFIYNT